MIPGLFLILGSSASAATLTVTSSADTGPGSLRETVAMASPGDSIIFDSSINGMTIELMSGEIPITMSLTILGNDTANTVISGSMMSRIFNISNAGMVEIADLKLTMGQVMDNGGAVKITSSDVTFWNVAITNSMAGVRGGGIHMMGGNVWIKSSWIYGNTASGAAANDGGGGIYNDGGVLTIEDYTVITDNEADGAAGSGGGIFNETGGTLTVTNSTINSNTATRAGGGIEDNSGAMGGGVTLTEITMNMNHTGPAPGNGGGFHITGPGDAWIYGGWVNNNTAAREGGGLWNGSGTMVVDGVTIDGNVASGDAANDGGGGIFNNGGTLIVQNNTMITNNVADGEAGSGGGIFNETGGTLTVTNSTINSNTATRAGGGIEDNSGTEGGGVNLTDITLNMNHTGPAPGNGGGFHITGPGDAWIYGGWVNNNTAAREGGGLWNGTGTMVVDGVTIDGNVASGDAANDGGGGIFNNGGTLIVQNNTIITNNVADGEAGSGGGIFNETGGTLTVTNSTINSNTATRAGGGIEDNSGAMGGGVTLTDITMNMNHTGPAPGNGGGFHITGPGDAWIYGGWVNNNTAAREGGGLWNGSGTMVVDGVTIDGNVASGDAANDGGGGIFNNGGTLIVQNNTMITNNVADGEAGSGGGIFNETGGTLTVTNSTINSNTAKRAGGGIEDNSGADGGGVTLTDITLNMNHTGPAPGNGGGFHITGPGDAWIYGGWVNNNSAAREGGGLWNGTGTMVVNGVTIDGNIASGDAADDGGGGLFNNGGTLIVKNTTVTNNLADGAAGSGGGLFNLEGTVTVDSSYFYYNEAVRAGGAIEALEGSTMVAHSVLNNNNVSDEGVLNMFAPGNGGAVHVTGAGTFTFSMSTADGNSAGNEGGGLWGSNNGEMIISRSTVSNNYAPKGGGLFLQGGGSATGILAVEYSTISGNSANTGGGIEINDGFLTLLASTIADNTAMTAGGGVFQVGGGITANSTLIADNSAPTAPDFSGTFNEVEFTLVENPMGASGIVDGEDGNITGVDPGLQPLADNGGPTMTMALTCGSVALNAGDPTLMANDQRNMPVQNGTRDIGAFELQSACPDGDCALEIMVVWGCHADSTGWAAVESITGQQGSTSILWSTGAPVEYITGLNTNTYSVTVTDAAGCSASYEFYLDCGSPCAVDFTLTSGCGPDSLGWASVDQITGAVGSTSILWSTDETTSEISGLGSGQFWVVVTDEDGCSTKKGFALECQEDCPIEIVLETGCNGYEGWASVSNIMNATDPTSILWSTGATTSYISGLPSGDHWVTVTDAEGCWVKEDFHVNCEMDCELEVMVDWECPGEGNGSASVEYTGATYPVTILWSNGATTGSISGLSSGDHWVTVTDAEDCWVKMEFHVECEMDEEPCQLRTQTMGGWGAPAAGNNPGVYRDMYFASAFPNGLMIGCDNTLHLTSAMAVQNFLPSGGQPQQLPSGSMMNPSGYGNTLAGQLVALTLSVGFDNNDPDFGSGGMLADAVINTGLFAGWTVQQLLDEANNFIGGCGSTYSASQLNGALSMVNENFVDGTTNMGNVDCAPDSGYRSLLNTGEAITVRAYPVPANNILNIDLVSDRDGDISLLMMDATGRMVIQQGTAAYDAGEQRTVVLDVNALGNGTYLLTILRDGVMVRTERIIIAR